jgi:D-lactate dehydrogenase
MVALIVDKYDGSLKAEHGTGVNMAPFVEREWGAKATEMMWRVKQLADPDGILGPGIVLNRDPQAHLRNLKSTPEIEEVATKCIECGFCEPVCPSRNVTTTPRQRIVIRREMARQSNGSPVRSALESEWDYDAVETCAADGSCAEACPVGIDTGKLIKGVRAKGHSASASWTAKRAAERFATVERAARAVVRFGAPAARATGRTMPRAAPASLPSTSRDGAAAVYMPACINRVFGNPRGTPTSPTVPEALVAVSARAGMPVWIPPDVTGHCCGTPWSSKGYAEGHGVIGAAVGAALDRWSEHGSLPLVIDASSCAHGLLNEIAPDGVKILDSIDWVHDRLLPRLRPRRKLGRVAVHPNCSASHLRLTPKLAAIASALAEEVVIPAASGCCGMAGDRGWLYPELPASALRDVAEELAGTWFDDAWSSNRTCEIALQQVTGRPYRSFLLAFEELTRGADALKRSGRSAGQRPPAGLCDSCSHQQLIRNTRGSEFSLCGRSRTEPERFSRYPRLPVRSCEGYERGPSEPTGEASG